jgi:hypothetical protein
MRNDLEESGCYVIEVLSRNLPRGTEENYEKRQDSRYPGRNSNQAPSGIQLYGVTAKPTYLLRFLIVYYSLRHVATLYQPQCTHSNVW